MNRGIEAAFWGALGRDPELKTSRAGNAFCRLSVAVNAGEDGGGKSSVQWMRAVVFGEQAEKIAATARKGDRVYCEGVLTLESWRTSGGEERWGLSIACWKCEKVVTEIGMRRANSGTTQAQQGASADNDEVDLAAAMP
jgi:single stranded DNA-binding protein